MADPIELAPLPPENTLVYGPGTEGAARAVVYTRYAMGDRVVDIAKDSGLPVTQVYNLLRSRPTDYAKAKEEREAFSNLRTKRTVHGIDNVILRFVERLNESPEVMPSLDTIKVLGKINVDLARRDMLNDGKATDRTQVDVITSDDAIRERLRAQDEAGHGLAVDDIGADPLDVINAEVVHGSDTD